MVHMNVELSTGNLDSLVVLSEDMKGIDNPEHQFLDRIPVTALPSVDRLYLGREIIRYNSSSTCASSCTLVDADRLQAPLGVLGNYGQCECESRSENLVVSGPIYTVHQLSHISVLFNVSLPQITDQRCLHTQSITKMACDVVRDSYFITIKVPTDGTGHRLRGLNDILFFFPCIYRHLPAVPPTTLPILPGLPPRDVRIQTDMLRGKPGLRVGRPRSSQWGY